MSGNNSRGFLLWGAAEFAGLLLFAFMGPWLLILVAVAMLLLPFIMLVVWHRSTAEQKQRWTTPPPPEEWKPPGLMARILWSCFLAAVAILCGMALVTIPQTPKPDYFAAIVMALSVVVIPGLIYWIWRPAWRAQAR